MARLLSIKVGLPQDIVWRGRVVRTAIWKDARSRPAHGTPAQRRW